MNQDQGSKKKVKNLRGYYVLLGVNIINVLNNLWIKNDTVLLICGVIMIAAIPLILYDAVKSMESKQG